MKKQLLLVSMLALGSFGFLRAQTTPTADLLDVQFNIDGSAVDVSPSGFTIEKGSGTAPVVAYDSTVKKYVARFMGKSTSFYRVNYEGNTAFTDKVKQQFTLEVYAKVKAAGTMDIIGTMESGGFGFEQASSGPMELWFGYEGGSYTNVGNQNIYNAANPEYTHLVATYDGTSIKLYINGSLSATTALSGGLRLSASSAAHWIGIGGDANPNPNVVQAPFIGDISLTRLYSTALSESDISSLYDDVSGRNSDVSFDELNNWIRAKLPAYIGLTTDPAKKTAAESLIATGTDLMEDWTTDQTTVNNFIAGISSSLPDLDDVLASDVLPRFAVISDTHVGNGSRDWNKKINGGLDILINEQPKLDAIFVVGDITDWGTEAMFRDAKTLFSKAESALPVYYVCMGNHDWYDSEDCDERFMETFGQPVNQLVDIKGYPFILISMETPYANQAYLAKTQQFLTDTLAYVAQHYPGKPIFMFAHIPVTNTVYGSFEIGGGDSWGSSNIEAICNQYPQIVLFSGHSHYPLGDPRSIHQNHFTAINDGTMSYSELETGMSEGIHPPRFDDVTEGCIVTVQNNEDIQVKRWDFTRNEQIQQPWLIEAPFDGSNFTYANRTGGTAPTFSGSATATVSDVTENECTVTYPQASDDEVVHHYKIQVRDQSGATIANPMFTQFSQFYLNSETPETLSWTLTGLQSGKQYAVQIIAVDSYGNESAPLVSESFTTKAYIPDPSVVAPVADLLDFKFKSDNTGADISAMGLPTVTGSTAPTNIYDPELQQYVSVFTGDAYNYYKLDYQSNTAFKAALVDGFTIDIVAMSEATDDMCPVSSQESGGFGIEQAGGGGPMQMWMGRQSGGYTQVGDQSVYSSTSPAYAHLTFSYDGDSLRSYYNGVPGEQKEETSGLRFTALSDAQWISIGGDAHNSSYTQYAFKGKVGLVRIFDKVLSRDEIVRLQEQIDARKAMTKVGALNEMIAVKLPKVIQDYPDTPGEQNTGGIGIMAASTSEMATALLEEGWDLMNSMATTDPDIEAYLAKVDNQIGDILPVGLTGFNVQQTGPSQVSVSWNSNVEGQVTSYEIQRSTDQLKSWQKIASIPAKGNNSHYQYTDQTPASGYNYYRVIEKMNSAINAPDQISDILSVNITTIGGPVKVYPNPSSGLFHLDAGSTLKASDIQIYNYGGLRLQVPVSINANKATINLSGKAAGVYIIKYKDQNYKVILQ